jgi:hypothetical protein
MSTEAEPTVTTDIGQFAMIPVWVFEMDLTPGEFVVYAVLRSFADGRGDGAKPFINTIAERGHVSRGLVEKTITKLSRLGMVQITHRKRADGSFTASSYHLVSVKPSGGSPTHVGEGSPTHVGEVPHPRTYQEQTSEQTTVTRPKNTSTQSQREASSSRGKGSCSLSEWKINDNHLDLANRLTKAHLLSRIEAKFRKHYSGARHTVKWWDDKFSTWIESERIDDSEPEIAPGSIWDQAGVTASKQRHPSRGMMTP